MKLRDLAIVAAVGLIAVLALGDAVRQRAFGGEDPPARTRPAERPSEVARIRPGFLEGRLLWTDANTCALRGVDLATLERIPFAIRTDCGLWGAPQSDVVAVGTRGAGGNVREFTLLAVVGTEGTAVSGSYLARPNSLVWSSNGRRVAWCEGADRGAEVDVGIPAPRRLRVCPLAYTAQGGHAYARGRTLMSRGRPLLVARQPVEAASIAPETIAVYGPGEISLLFVPRRPTEAFPLQAPRFAGPPAFGRRNCGALGRAAGASEPTMLLVGLGCAGIRGGRSFRGHDAAWSPEGRFLAIATPTEIVFHHVNEAVAPVRLPVRAEQVLWLR